MGKLITAKIVQVPVFLVNLLSLPLVVRVLHPPVPPTVFQYHVPLPLCVPLPLATALLLLLIVKPPIKLYIMNITISTNV